MYLKVLFIYLSIFSIATLILFPQKLYSEPKSHLISVKGHGQNQRESKETYDKIGTGISTNSAEKSITKTVLGQTFKASSSSTLINNISYTLKQPKKNLQIKTLDSSTENLTKTIVAFGVLFLLICGILLFRNTKKSNDFTK